MYLKVIPIVGLNNYVSHIATLPADAPSGIYEVQIAFDGEVDSPFTIRAYSQGNGSTRPETIKQLEVANRPVIQNTSGFNTSFWSYENETSTSTFGLSSGDNIVRLSCFVHHVLGEETKLVEFSSNNAFSTDEVIAVAVVSQIA